MNHSVMPSQDGGVTILPTQVADPLAAMQAWLGNIDADELERTALESMELGSGSYSAEVLAVLRRWAGGDP